MDRAGKKVRDISYHSGKNGGMAVVHSEAARAYSKYLEERPEVASYEACKPLDATRLNSVQKTDIRGEYFQGQWASDFFIRFADGTTGVRELVSASPDEAVRSRKAGAVPPLLGRAGGERLENRHSGQMRGRAGVLRLARHTGRVQDVQGKKHLFSHFLLQTFLQKCGKRVYVPCTPCTD